MAVSFKRNLGTAYLSVLPEMTKFRTEFIRALGRISNDMQGDIAAAFRTGAQQGIADGAAAGLSSTTTNITNNVSNAASQGVSVGITQGAQQSSRAAGRSITNNTSNATASGSRTGTRTGLLKGFGALAGIAATAFAAAGIANLVGGAIQEGLERGFNTRKIGAALNLDEGETGTLNQTMRKLTEKGIFDEGVLGEAAKLVSSAHRDLLSDSDKFSEAVNALATLGDVYEFDIGMLSAPLAEYVKRGGNIPEYADMLVGALSTETGGMEDIVDSLVEYRTEFTGAEEEFINLSKFLTTHGLRNTDVLADQIRESRTRAATGGEDWSNAVKAAGLDPKEVQKAAAEGGKVWVETFTELIHGAGNIEGNATAAIEFLGGGPMADYARVYTELTQEQWEAFRNDADETAATVESLNATLEQDPLVQFKQIGLEVRGMLWDLSQPILEALLPVLGELAAWLNENRETLMAVGQVVVDFLLPKLTWLIEKFQEVMTWVAENEEAALKLANLLGIGLVGAIVVVTASLIAMAAAAVIANWPWIVGAALIGLIIFALWRLNKGVVETFGSWGQLGEKVVGFFESAYNGVSGFVKGIIDWIDQLVEKILGVDIGFSDLMGAAWGARAGMTSGGVPGLASGGTVLPQSGGTIVRLAEAGRAETVVDTGLMNRHLSTTLALFESGSRESGSGAGINIEGDLILQASSADDARSLHKKIAEQNTFDGRRRR